MIRGKAKFGCVSLLANWADSSCAITSASYMSFLINALAASSSALAREETSKRIRGLQLCTPGRRHCDLYERARVARSHTADECTSRASKQSNLPFQRSTECCEAGHQFLLKSVGPQIAAAELGPETVNCEVIEVASFWKVGLSAFVAHLNTWQLQWCGWNELHQWCR